MSPRRPTLLLLVALALAAAGCSSPSTAPSSTAASASASPSPVPSPASSEPAPSSEESPAAESVAPEPSEDELGPFSCDTPVDSSGSAGHAQITGVRVGTHGDYDRIVFEFAGEGGADAFPAYTVEEAAPPFRQDGSGLPVEVRGDEFVRIYLFGGTKQSPTGGLTYTGPTEFNEEMPRLDQLLEIGDFEAVSTWVAGLHASDGCYRITELESPSRLVIDLEH